MNIVEIKNLINEASHEIKDLRKDNEKKAIELGAYNRILSALEAHRPIERYLEETVDVTWKLDRAESLIEKEIEQENRDADLKRGV